MSNFKSGEAWTILFNASDFRMAVGQGFAECLQNKWSCFSGYSVYYFNFSFLPPFVPSFLSSFLLSSFIFHPHGGLNQRLCFSLPSPPEWATFAICWYKNSIFHHLSLVSFLDLKWFQPLWAHAVILLIISHYFFYCQHLIIFHRNDFSIVKKKRKKAIMWFHIFC